MMCLQFSPGAFAQVIEQYPAPILRGEQKTGLPIPPLDQESDDRSLGVTLKKLIIVSRQGKITDAEDIGFENSSSINLTQADSNLHTFEFMALLKPYIGQELSRKNIADIRADITRYYRHINRPLVAVIVPPQEVSSGALMVETIPFYANSKTSIGNNWTREDYIMARIRQATGEPIDSKQLVEDINWLNLNPYRNLSVVFEPGDKPGSSNMIIRSNEQKPWSAWTGISNSGSKTGDRNRISAGFHTANLPIIDSQLSYLFTGSANSIKTGDFFELDNNPGYVSHSSSYFTPLNLPNGYRHKLFVQASYTRSNSSLVEPFTQESQTNQYYLEYGIPAWSKKSESLEYYAGIDRKHQKNNVYFDNTLATESHVDIVQLVAGLRGTISTPLTVSRKSENIHDAKTSFDIRFITSPGGLSVHNNDESFVTASGNSQATASYSYIYGSLDHIMPLHKGFALKSEFTFQYSPDILPSLEKFSYGGAGSVRGYLTNESFGDSGYTITNDLMLPQILFSYKKSAINTVIAPYIFMDYGQSYDVSELEHASLFSVGAGIDMQTSYGLSGSLIYGHALKDGTITRKNDHNISFNLKFKH